MLIMIVAGIGIMQGIMESVQAVSSVLAYVRLFVGLSLIFPSLSSVFAGREYVEM
jgi:hypothetical protein